jgi:hypothetical protein
LIKGIWDDDVKEFELIKLSTRRNSILYWPCDFPRPVLCQVSPRS